jgi:hypothetical protein
MPRLVVPRPTPKSVPPPAPPADATQEISETAIHEVTALRASKSAPPPPLPSTRPIELQARTTHPGLLLARTIGFFVVALAVDGARTVRAYLKAHWIRASARARA